MDFLVSGIMSITWQQGIMYAVGVILIYLAIKKEFEPSLLLPIGFGAILVNLPNSGVINQTLAGIGDTNGIIEWLFHVGIEASEALPILLFIGIGAMIDFGPLLSQPIMFLFGAAAQFGIFAAVLFASILGFDLKDAASIGIIGAADGPTSILVSQILGSKYVGAIAVAAYSYMALVPIIQPFAIRLVTTKKERCIKMPYNPKNVSKTTRIVFPIAVTFIAGLVAPMSVALVGFLMFGNLIRECGVLETLSGAAQNMLANLITLLLGITIAFSMKADAFVNVNTIMIMAIGLFAFVFDTIGGVLFAKFINLFRKQKLNPMVGAAGISAFPMSSRVVQKMALKEDPTNILIMHAAGANVSGQIASVVAGGMILSLVAKFI
ncbi:sodium ion-translocating decarboxylase subunit beta [Anaerosacchariphilus polymeriproducens]|uniref:Sodium ion-translocating decarboxylase subunit beta n=1 Tax=Anaerosacchariphilus polymeriproducens TaxID=1812858 RepID=A0A371AT47_9FIRM|nr:sodium ion-translocating decarboxylase subunit beta [Anaerosacchariphilus polymeriproducens]RDU22738.1 sodium ion-translocating decarboxylase subunit beta [Anaerosacchariphilus polymeriproducens]